MTKTRKEKNDWVTLVKLVQKRDKVPTYREALTRTKDKLTAQRHDGYTTKEGIARLIRLFRGK